MCGYSLSVFFFRFGSIFGKGRQTFGHMSSLKSETEAAKSKINTF